MEITKVRIRLIRNKDRLKAIASITLDDELILNDIRINQTPKRLCAEFPRNPYARDKNHLEFIVVPKTPKVRNDMEQKILEEYDKKIRICMKEVV